MTTKHLKLFTTCAVAALVSCSVNDPINEAPGAHAVQFTAAIAGETAVPISRAAGSDWDGNDAVGIFMVQDETTLEINKKYVTASGDGSFKAAESSQTMYFPLDPVNFIAYYPYESGASLTTPITVIIGTEQTTDNQPGFDLLYSDNAKGIKESDNPVTLAFGHQLSKLVMEIVPGVGFTTDDFIDMTVTIKGMYTLNKFDLSTGKLGSARYKDDIISRTIIAGREYDAIILPSEGIESEGDYYVEFIVDPEGAADTFVWEMAAGTGFDAGYQYNYTVNISRKGVYATGEISQWTTSDRGTVIAD